PETRDIASLLGGPHLFDLELVGRKSRTQQEAQGRVVVHHKDTPTPKGPKILVELRRIHHGGGATAAAHAGPPRSVAPKRTDWWRNPSTEYGRQGRPSACGTAGVERTGVTSP